jgi:hypothetical protein
MRYFKWNFFFSTPITKKIYISAPSWKLLIQMPLFSISLGEHTHFFHTLCKVAGCLQLFLCSTNWMANKQFFIFSFFFLFLFICLRWRACFHFLSHTHLFFQGIPHSSWYFSILACYVDLLHVGSMPLVFMHVTLVMASVLCPFHWWIWHTDLITTAYF